MTPVSMVYVKFPCKDCPDRYPGCHDNCEKYKAAKEKHNAAAKTKLELDAIRADNIRRTIACQKGKTAVDKRRNRKLARNR